MDNFFALEVHKSRSVQKALGQLSKWHKAARECWAAHNIPSARDKSVASSLEAKELGCLIDGFRGTLSTTVQRRLDAISLTFLLIGAPHPHRMWLAVCAGQWNFIFQFRRALSCLFFDVWRGIAEWRSCRVLPGSLVKELLMAVALSPLMVIHLRAQPDVLVTVSDACESGAGIAASAGLSAYGVRSVLSLPAELPFTDPSGLALISLFGGIEAGRRALDLLGITPVRHIAVEIDKGARRAAHEVWPEIHYFRDIVEFTRQVLHDALAGVGTRKVLVEGGSPCQGLSGANATKKGFEDPRSKLFYEMIRVIKDLHQEKLEVFYMGKTWRRWTQRTRQCSPNSWGLNRT